ncbi:uncharacterized protein MONBRDRAFT_13808 [Monosiga brevicollis MX1]|uniref:Beta-catenin-interacting ICAT domain-containing protein n=1 Tax=Monosiga brevicollis TaxID=81824 RepID=A9UPF0_MONBE|nr:uncharacterized protein MONBRDRAFT_13808 [Monosiga brevicollis MX1]EDQ92861.1 predicted protein [Monosiga brevicollis MX1]|eukprot:XP_001742623.1 hypothetical protein [Monosiga brevicollis MX1]
MASRGNKETDLLKQNMEEQLERLMVQLKDLEELKLAAQPRAACFCSKAPPPPPKMTEGDMSLVDQFGAMQLAIQAAVSDAFKTPEVIRLFAKREPGQLRERLAEMERDVKIGKISAQQQTEQKVEILTALRKLGEQISPEEAQFLSANSSAALDEFEQVSSNLGSLPFR